MSRNPAADPAGVPRDSPNFVSFREIRILTVCLRVARCAIGVRRTHFRRSSQKNEAQRLDWSFLILVAVFKF